MSEGITDKRQLEIVGHGGTIMCRPMVKDDGRVTFEPHHGSLNILYRAIPQELQARFSLIRAECGELIDSSQALADVHIQSIVAEVRRHLREESLDALILLYGTDTMSDLVAALGNGVSKEELGEKTVIVTGAMRHLESTDPPTDAVSNFMSAVTLSSLEGSRGKMGLLFGQRFFSPRGIEKPRNAARAPFQCRFPPQAELRADGWAFRARLPFDVPIGITNQSYALMRGVETHMLTPTSDYETLPHALQKNKATILLAPGGGLRTDDESVAHLQNAARVAIGPIVVVSDTMRDADDPLMVDRDFPEAGYVGENYPSYLISGGAMTKTEARIMVSHLLAMTQGKGMTKSEVLDFASSNMALYPFRDVYGNS